MLYSYMFVFLFLAAIGFHTFLYCMKVNSKQWLPGMVERMH